MLKRLLLLCAAVALSIGIFAPSGHADEYCDGEPSGEAIVGAEDWFVGGSAEDPIVVGVYNADHPEDRTGTYLEVFTSPNGVTVEGAIDPLPENPLGLMSATYCSDATIEEILALIP